MAYQHLVLEGSLHTPILLFYVKIDAGSEGLVLISVLKEGSNCYYIWLNLKASSLRTIHMKFN
jgi:hypothetical protein